MNGPDQFSQTMRAKGWYPQPDGSMSKKPPPETLRSIAQGVDREMTLHKQIMEYCGQQWPRWQFIRARSDQPSTIAVGAHDLTIFASGGRVFCFECKRSGGKLSTEQEAWVRLLKACGHTVHTVYSFEQFLEIVK